MSSISGKSSIDWAAFAAEIAPVETLSDAPSVKRKSRDFFWFSPILNQKLRKSFGDLVACPKTQEELALCLKAAYAHDIPVVIRGGGTGNYGQAVPLDGGLIIETTGLNKVIEIKDGYVRVEAGCMISDLNEDLRKHGQELAVYPSTHKIATIGGFVAGGSSGVGSISNGMLRDQGNIKEITALSVEAEPKLHSFTGDDINCLHHAWGLNGVIVDVTVRTIPTEKWMNCIAGFSDYRTAYGCGYELAKSKEIAPRLASTIDSRIPAYFPQLAEYIEQDSNLIVTLIADSSVAAFKALVEEWGGTLYMSMTEEEMAERKLPDVFEFSYNHTTLQVLKKDRSATYLQIGCPTPPDKDRVAALHKELGEEAWMHHEYALLNNEIVTFDVPIVWFKSEEQLRAVEAKYENAGFPVFDAHTHYVEGGGLKNVDYRHLAWKKRLDPKGLLNSAKSAHWDRVKHLSAEEIEAEAAE